MRSQAAFAIRSQGLSFGHVVAVPRCVPGGLKEARALNAIKFH
jgi:hypothetical protein